MKWGLEKGSERVGTMTTFFFPGAKLQSFKGLVDKWITGRHSYLLNQTVSAVKCRLGFFFPQQAFFLNRGKGWGCT